MNNENYWKNIADEYENVLRNKNMKIEDLKDELYNLKYNTCNYELILSLINAFETSDNTSIQILIYLINDVVLLNSKNIYMIDSDNDRILKIYKKTNDGYEITYNFNYKDIIGFKTIKKIGDEK